VLVVADLQTVAAAGLAPYLTVPEEAFEIVDADPAGRPGVQPFAPGSLFAGGLTTRNALLPQDDPMALALPGQQLEYAVLRGPAGGDTAAGRGEVARLLLCCRVAGSVEITVEEDPVRETRLVLSDGRREQRFRAIRDLAVTVVGPGTGIAVSTWAEAKTIR
jgi:hypothetical protein